MMAPTLRALAVLAIAVAATSTATAEERFKLLVSGAYATKSLEFSNVRSFTDFAETGTSTGSFSVDGGAGFDAGLQFNVTKHLGVMASLTQFSRDETGHYEASLPHPLYFDRPRGPSGDLPTASYKETAGHFDLALTGNAGRWEFSGWGGVSLFQVETRVLASVQYQQTYPYDEVTVTGTPTSVVKDKPTGYNVGGGLDCRIAKHFAVGAQIRYSQAKVKLTLDNAAATEFDAGGFQAGGGLRFVF
jgi:opacity protein-like surface antigen